MQPWWRLYQYLLWIMACLWSLPCEAGPLVTSSSTPLTPVLNPAIIQSEKTGVAYGASIGNRGLFNNAPNNCQIRGFSECPEDKSRRVTAYTDYDQWAFFSVENLTVEKKEKDARQSFSQQWIQQDSNQRFALALAISSFRVGLAMGSSHIKIRESYTDIFSPSFQRTQKNQFLDYSYGIQWELFDDFYLAYYGNVNAHITTQIEKESQLNLPNVYGFQGTGLGVQHPSWSWELFHLFTHTLQNDEVSLTGGNIEITLGPVKTYMMLMNDNYNNYFNSELLYNNSVSVGMGVGLSGENVQFMIGRDPRYFAGWDGGLMGTLGWQF